MRALRASRVPRWEMREKLGSWGDKRGFGRVLRAVHKGTELPKQPGAGAVQDFPLPEHP